MVNTMEKLNELMYGAALVAVQWSPFAHTMQLSLFDGQHTHHLLLDGVHVCCFRQGVGSREQMVGESCWIDVFHMTSNHEFLDRFLSKQLGLSGDIVLYDTRQKRYDDPDFVRPSYLSVISPAGYLDVVFESWKLLEQPS